jgi:hypothetical protein
VSASATIDRPDVEAYLAAVREQLADLGAEERDELLADVEASILESAEESDAPIAARLGPPEDFAAELRAAAGLGGGHVAARRPTLPPLRERLLETWRSPRVAAAGRILRELAPIWWVARAYVVVAIVTWLIDDDRNISPYEVVTLGGPDVGLGALVVAVVASVALGVWQRRRHGMGRAATPILVANLALAALAVPLYAELHDWLKNRPAPVVFVEEPVVPAGLTHDGAPVLNVYPYSRDGRLLLDVLLFDQSGAPLSVRPEDSTDAERRVLRTRRGADVFNSFPIRYFEPGTLRVSRPGAGPRVPWSPIVTPALPVGATER